MTVRELIQELLLNSSLDDEIFLEVKTESKYNWSTGKARSITKTEYGVIVSSEQEL